MSDVLLETKELNVYYGAIHAVKGINISVKEGEITTLIGANGAGKTSTLGAIIGLVKGKKGNIIYRDKEISHLRPDAIVKLGISLSPEGRRIFPNLTVDENLRMGAFSRKDKEGIEKDREWVLELFPRLKERLKQMGGTLSGGEQQMLAIARALMSNPSILMMDEPSLGLAPLLVKEVFEVIETVKKEGKTVLLVEQNAAAALSIADYGYVLETGNIVLEGKGKELLENDEVRRAYLGVTE